MPKNCPMCDVGPKWQVADPDNARKTWCKACGTKFFDPTRG